MNYRFICERPEVQLCPDGWIPSTYSETCIKVYINQVQWDVARDICGSEGGDLVSILNERMNHFLEGQINSSGSSFWIGLNDREAEGNFTWLGNDQLIQYGHWATQPNNDELNDCGKIYHTNGWYLHECEDKAGFICERFSDCGKEALGMACPHKCSTCAGKKPKCDRRTGFCFYGCVAGYAGELCDYVCDPGTYGANCLNVCNVNCAGANKSCNFKTGHCILGCNDGYEGAKCNIAIVKESLNRLLHQHVTFSFAVVMFVAVVCAALTFISPRGREENALDGEAARDPLDSQDEITPDFAREALNLHEFETDPSKSDDLYFEGDTMTTVTALQSTKTSITVADSRSTRTADSRSVRTVELQMNDLP
ncbi:C-type mannose receptor 2-like [Elysia marginata]|uniref:C-type mannose receptor 2-like n=1 Tax=Elysia marginata TaxID=1093978 RepID=A0AAV4F121_9GAST|nr:C-type mannose receptor 2-like [Elysia marginata]